MCVIFLGHPFSNNEAIKMKLYIMKKQLLTVVLGTTVMMSSLALASDDMADTYFSKNNPTLTPQEKEAIAIRAQ